MTSIRLPPGRWVTRGCIKVYEPDQQAITFDDDERSFWETLAHQFAGRPFVDLTPVTGELCDDCGCLLAPNERCPSCLVWAIRNAERWSWAQQSKVNRGRIWDIPDHRKRAA